jgi:transcriptional regulator with XRE-family HTH domain
MTETPEIPAGWRVRAARALRNASLDELAERIGEAGLGARTLRKIEGGDREVRAMELRTIAAALDLPYEFFTADFWDLTGQPRLPGLEASLGAEPEGASAAHGATIAEITERFERRDAQVAGFVKRFTERLLRAAEADAAEAQEDARSAAAAAELARREADEAAAAAAAPDADPDAARVAMLAAREAEAAEAEAAEAVREAAAAAAEVEEFAADAVEVEAFAADAARLAVYGDAETDQPSAHQHAKRSASAMAQEDAERLGENRPEAPGSRRAAGGEGPSR